MDDVLGVKVAVRKREKKTRKASLTCCCFLRTANRFWVKSVNRGERIRRKDQKYDPCIISSAA